MSENGQVTRRGFLVLGGAALAAASGCTSDGTPRSGPTSTPFTDIPDPVESPSSSPAPTSTSGPTGPRLPSVTPWSASAGDVEPRVKARAVRVVEAIGTWSGARAGSPAAAVGRLTALGAPGRLAEQAGALLGPGVPAAVVEVVEAQYGGILASTASVLVVCRQWRVTPDRAVAAGGTTVDVRLSRGTAHWEVTALHPARPGPAQRPLSPLARRVLTHGRINLPPAGVADVRAGQVHDSVLSVMLRLASTYRIGVSVVRSGHPLYVFGTTRLSDHPQGRAFDTFQIDGHPVVDRTTPRDLVTGYMQALARAGSYNVGGPYLLPGGGFFSDATHHDHVHAGFAS